MCLLVARGGNAEFDRYPQPMDAGGSAPMPDPVCTYQRYLTSCMALGICRWVTSLAGGSSCGESKSLLYGARGIEHYSALKRHQNVAQEASAPVNEYLSVSATRTTVSNDECREGVQGSGQDGG